MTLYDVLEVSPNASEEVIKMAYKALAKKYHPDVFEGDITEAEAKMKEINAAFEILSNAQKREEYDAFLRCQQQYFQAEKDEQNTVSEEYNAKTNQRERNRRTTNFKKNWIPWILLGWCFIETWHPYAESYLQEHSLLFGLIDFCILSVVMMIVPIFIGAVKNSIELKNINRISILNSVLIWSLSSVLYGYNVIEKPFLGWIPALMYYFVNKQFLSQIQEHKQNRRKVVGVLLCAAGITVSILIGSVCIAVDLPQENQWSFVYEKLTTKHYRDTNGKVYDIQRNTNCVILRSVTLDYWTSRMAFLEIEQEDFDEEKIIKIMDKYGSSQGGGTGYVVYPNDLIEEVDQWCFADDRKPGDITTISTDYGYTICYIVKIFK